MVVTILRHLFPRRCQELMGLNCSDAVVGNLIPILKLWICFYDPLASQHSVTGHQFFFFQSWWFDMFPSPVARLAQPPGFGREQEVPLAAAVSAALGDTIAAQLHCCYCGSDSRCPPASSASKSWRVIKICVPWNVNLSYLIDSVWTSLELKCSIDLSG